MIQGSPIDLCVDSPLFPGASQVPQDLPQGRTFSFAHSLDYSKLCLVACLFVGNFSTPGSRRAMLLDT